MPSQPEKPGADTLTPVVSSRPVAATASDAFTAFVEGLGAWWDPRLTPDASTYSGAEIEPGVGGAVRLRHRDDAYDIARVTAWQPGERLGLEFWLALERAHPTTVTVEFTAHEDGTLVTLSHGGWTAHNAAHRAKFTEWPQLLDRFAAHLDA